MMEKDDKTLIDKLTDWQSIALRDQYLRTTEFLDLHQQALAREHIKGYEKQWFFFGGYGLAERCIICFLPDYLIRDFELDNFWSQDLNPMIMIKISSSDRKFSRELGHRDYLGALINLGVKRSVLGDILVEDHCAYVFVLKHIATYIKEQLVKVGNQTISIAFDIEPSQANTERRYKAVTTTVASLRLDNIVKAIFNMSRTNSTTLIGSKKVFLNHQLCIKNDIVLKEGDILTVRGLGKGRLTTIGHTTKKDRIVIKAHIYQ